MGFETGWNNRRGKVAPRHKRSPGLSRKRPFTGQIVTLKAQDYVDLIRALGANTYYANLRVGKELYACVKIGKGRSGFIVMLDVLHDKYMKE